MGAKNGRGIYRTKATNEKFVGSWLLGLKHGKGMIIGPRFRFVGNWYHNVVSFNSFSEIFYRNNILSFEMITESNNDIYLYNV